MTPEDKRLKEIRYELYLRAEMLKQIKKEIKQLNEEADMIQGYKNMEKGRSRKKK